MEITVNGVKKELYAEGKNGIEWTRDLIGDDESLVYNEDTEEYEMSGEAFEWWRQIVETANEVAELEEELTAEQLEIYISKNFSFCDMETEYSTRLDFLNELLGR